MKDKTMNKECPKLVWKSFDFSEGLVAISNFLGENGEDLEYLINKVQGEWSIVDSDPELIQYLKGKSYSFTCIEASKSVCQDIENIRYVKENKAPKSKDECGECDCWGGDSEVSHGKCRRFPPVVLSDGTTSQPTVPRYGWCREFSKENK